MLYVCKIEMVLIVEYGGERTGYEFKCSAAVSHSDASGLRIGMEDGVITRGMVVYAGSRRYPVTDDIEALPADTLLTQYQMQLGSRS